MTASKRAPLTRERILQGALSVADSQGVNALTIRALSTHLGVKPMAIYHHVSTKDEILDGIVDLVFAEIDLPVPGREWSREVRRRAASTRIVLGRHPWAISLMGTRTSPGAHTLAHLDAVIGVLREAGMSLPTVAHAVALLDNFVFGFALQEAMLPMQQPEDVIPLATSLLDGMPDGEYPYLAELATDHVMQPGYDFGDEFTFGLDVVLAGIEAAAQHS